jgi:hypothetical protein
LGEEECGFVEFVEAELAAQDLERLGDRDGHYAGSEGGQEGGVGVEGGFAEIVLEVAVGVVVEKGVEGFSCYGGA